MFKIVPRIGTCDAGFSSSKFRSSCLPFVVKRPWKKFETTVVRLKRSYENTGNVVCLTTKGRQLERNFEELRKQIQLHCTFKILGNIKKK
jgi:hypothetical protein